MAKIIIESGMNFIADNIFHIEKSDVYKKTLMPGGIKTVEFIRVKSDKLLFIEAKSSFPKPDLPYFQNHIHDICEKFIHSLNLYMSIVIGVNEQLIPNDFKPPTKLSLNFVLVFNNFEQKWCSPIEMALTNKLSQLKIMTKIWKPEVSVINSEMAAKLNLI